ncbi:MAG: N-acetylmuramoyl-L-alanine amidase [Sphingobacteriia bacterium]|nr:MAG: N-acetylmuramoyl-L-alanine amidase [Sphingobacteriia bacterium]TAG29490.1 MAG: N-acetylmuramoyl-L-alanine amidase [Sphingobacteriia bacterium]TAH08002.1 MAG: N-acetylmuramoyl-L-alanine amidase [Sphingobacteriia bacterium]
MKPIFFVIILFLSPALVAQTSTPTGYRYGRTTGKLPALGYGMGADRLGGAKMGYIDTNVLLKVIDSTNDLYTVQLSKLHTAFLEKIYLKADTASPLKKPFYLTGSFLAKGDSAFDYLNINLEEKLPYKTWMEINPARIVVDIYGVQSNTNWVTQLSSLKAIKNVYYQQVEDDIVRVTIELNHQQHWGYNLSYKNKTLVVKVKRQPALLDIRKMIIAIDAGHGGTNTGAGGVLLKASEKEQTLLFAKALEQSLKKIGVKNIIMTRNSDTSIENKDRIIFLQEKNPDLLISLHLNSSTKSDIKGVSTYYKHIGFRPLSQPILKRMMELKLEEFGNIGHFNFALNAPTDFPNCLVEIAFLSNEADEKRIVNPLFKKEVASKIQLGIKDWLKSLSPDFNPSTHGKKLK